MKERIWIGWAKTGAIIFSLCILEMLIELGYNYIEYKDNVFALFFSLFFTVLFIFLASPLYYFGFRKVKGELKEDDEIHKKTRKK